MVCRFVLGVEGGDTRVFVKERLIRRWREERGV